MTGLEDTSLTSAMVTIRRKQTGQIFDAGLCLRPPPSRTSWSSPEPQSMFRPPLCEAGRTRFIFSLKDLGGATKQLDSSRRDASETKRDASIERRLKSLPEGFQITSVDHRVAQRLGKSGPLEETLVWDDKSETWKKAVAGLIIREGERRMFVSGMRGEDRVLVKGAGRDGLGTHYYWDKQKQLWVEIPNPPKPPPDGTSLSDLPGFAGAITPEGYVRYQWNEAEHEWIPVDDVPLGFTEGVSPKVDRRLEALSLDDYRTRIYWDAERKSWIDLETSMPPKPRPSPPGQYELIGLYRDGEYDEGDMAKVKGEERYFLWSKEKQK